MTSERKRCTLKTRDGKYITVRKYWDGVELDVIDKQGNDHLTQLDLLEDTDSKRVAFLFWHNKVCYIPTVEASLLKLRKSRANNDIKTLPTSSFFVKKDSGASGWYILESVQIPKWYLSIKSIKQGQRTTQLVLRSSDTHGLLVREI